MKHISRILILALILGMQLMSGASGKSVDVFVSVNNLKFFAKCSTSEDALAILGYGEKVTCLDVKSGWAKVKSPSGKTAFCEVDSLTGENPNIYDVTAYVRKSDALVYKRPSGSADSQSIKKNTQVTVVAVTGDKKWCRVKSDGNYGYMRKSDLSTEKAESDGKSVNAYVQSDILKLRAGASESSDVKAYACFGEKLSCLSAENGWAKVNYGGENYFCVTSGLTKTDPNTLSAKAYPQSSNVKIYEKPSTSSTVLTTVGTSDTLKCVAVTGDGKWARIERSGQYGYARKSDLGTEDASKAARIVRLAKQQLGKPYVYATRGPDTFDCAGLTYYCFLKVAGITLSRSGEGQGYDSRFTRINGTANLAAGDIVCFDTVDNDKDLTDHIGIYIGGGQFIHASSAGQVVMTSSLTSGYYNKVFSWGLRVL